jgi:FixJ family two-component response regulator
MQRDRKNSMTHRSSRLVIAVVDDDPSILRSLEYLLESADYGVRSFASGAELLKDSCLAEIGCLLSDVDLPGMDGFELLRQIQAVRPGLPVIYITAYPEIVKRRPNLGDGKPRLFTKPFHGPELLAAISEALRASS